MIDLYFVRHGQTEWNKIRKLQGEQDSPLTMEGISQAEALRDTLSIPFDLCITSPLGRAFSTAKILAGDSIPINKESLLTEMGFGKAEGLDKEVFKEKYPESFFNLWHHADKYDPSSFEGESFLSVVERAQKFLTSILLHKTDSKILIVSHGMMLKVIFGIIWKHSIKKFWDDPVPLNTSLTHVTLKQNEFEIVDFSNVSHLSDTESISYV